MSKREFLKVNKSKIKAVDVSNSNAELSEKEIRISYLRKLYNTDGGFDYSDEQLLEIKKFLERMTEIAIDCYKRMKRNNAINISNTNSDDKTESNTVFEGEYRRTG